MLIGELALFERLPGPDKEAKARLVRDALSNPPRFSAFVAYENGLPVAHIIYFFTYSTFLGKPTLFLEDLFVLEGYRGKGIGKELLGYCADEALRTGCGRMEWAVLTWNADAIRFYEGFGGKRLDWYFYRMTESELRAASDSSEKHRSR
ncbi:MAG: GNAT family N-acetyltransferase [Methanomassiliicoccales archaeon]|jgi:GNAT superfamily N-acetyltransferase